MDLMTKCFLLAATLVVTVRSESRYQFSPNIDPYMIIEGSELKLECTYSNPSILDLAIDKLKLEKKPFGSNTYTAVPKQLIQVLKNVDHIVKKAKFNVTMDDAGDYRCRYDDSSVNSVYELKIVVFKVTSDTEVLFNETQVVLVSEVTGLSGHNFTDEWTKNGTPLESTSINGRMTVDGNRLTITDLKREDIGLYTYTYIFKENNGQRVSNEISLLGQPEIDKKKFEKSKNLVQGDNLVLKCPATGYPVPTISWSKDGVQLRASEGIEITEVDGLKNGQLKVKELTFDDAGEYKCTANSSYADFPNAEAIITIRVKDRLAALWPFLGIVAEVIVLCIIIFLYEKRRSKQMEDEADSPDYSANTRDNQGDVRQRNVKT